MKTAIILAVLTLCACAPRIGYVDPQRAIQQTDEWKTVQSDAKTYADSRQPEVDQAAAALKKLRETKAPAADILAAETRANEVQQQVNAEVRRRLDAGAQKIAAVLAASIEPFAAEQHLSAIIPTTGALWIDPSSDLTGALAKRYDKTRAPATTAEVQAMRDKIAAYEARVGSPPLAKK